MPPVTDARVSLPARLRVVRHIADGGMASVWAAEDELLGRLVAVKLLSPVLAGDPDARRRFLREARAGARLGDCRHVVTIYDLGEHAGRAYMVMEFFAGGTLADRLRRPPPPSRPEVLRWLREAAEALDCGHRQGVVHRDVKPANLLLDEGGRLAVGDFGIAMVASEASVTRTGQVLGTAAYLSPEQARGRPATPASDRYALAVVAFELLTGERPFRGDHPAALTRAHVEADVPRASAGGAVPPAVDDVLTRGLAKDPSVRPRTAQALVDELEAALRDDRSEAPTAVVRPRRPPTPPPRPAPPAARRRGRRPAALALGALALASGAVAAIAVGGGGGGDDGGGAGTPTAHRATSAAARPAPARRTTSTAARRTTPATSAPATTAPAPPAATATGTTQAAPAPAAPKTPKTPKKAQAPATTAQPGATSPATLNDRGKALIDAGRPAEALPPLLAAVQAYRAQGATSGLPYAFALFNLGNALRLAGRPAEAVPVLEERLRVSSNQRGVVERELALARRQAGPS
jgi:eukaryotic-like serine/threonine-protein kinase